MKSRVFLIPLAVATLALSACAVTTTRQHPDFATRRPAIRTVGVVPPEATFRLITFTGEDQPIPASQDYVKAELPRLLAAELATKGFQLRDTKWIDGQLTAVPDLRFQTTQLQQNFAQAQKELYAGPLGIEVSKAHNTRRSLGGQVTSVSDPMDVDALVLARVEGFEKSGGEIAKDFAKSVLFAALTGSVVVQPTQGAAIGVALVDGTNGDILWTNLAGTQGDIKTALPGLVTFVLKDLPQGLPAGTAVASAPAVPVTTVAATSPPAAPAAQPVVASMTQPAIASQEPPPFVPVKGSVVGAPAAR